MGLIARMLLALRGIRVGRDSHVASSVRFDGAGPGKLLIGARTHVLDDVRFVAPALCVPADKATTIGDDCVIGVRVIVQAGVTIGDGAIIGTGSVVDRDVAAGSHVTGSPLQDIARR